MKDELFSIAACVGIYIMIPTALLLLRDWGSRRLMTAKKMEEYSRQHLNRLANPDLPCLERHYSSVLPCPLKELYSNAEDIYRTNFEAIPPDEMNAEDPPFVASYNPADSESLKYNFHDNNVYFAFADDGCSNAFIIDPRKEDPPVLFHDHDTGKIRTICPSMSDFMAWERRSTDDAAF